MSAILDGINAAKGPIIAEVEAYLNANKATVIADLKNAETRAIDEIGSIILANLPHGGLLSILEAPLANAIKNGEAQIIQALGGEDEALFQLALHELEDLRTRPIV